MSEKRQPEKASVGRIVHVRDKQGHCLAASGLSKVCLRVFDVLADDDI